MSRFGPSVAKNLMVQQHRNMAVASGSQADPIKRLFLEKIAEFQKSNSGLDERHKKMLNDDINRLKRVYRIDDATQLAKVDTNFADEVQVSLRDLDTSKELREKIYSGEYQRQLAVESKPKSKLLATIRYREPDKFHLPLIGKPNYSSFLDLGPLKLAPVKVGKAIPDYEVQTDQRPTPEMIQRKMRTVFGSKMPTIDDDKSPERDTVNYPRIPQQLDTPPTVGHIIPKSWFDFLHPKTGVTGGYVFGVGFVTFLLSKEWLVMEHELISGISLIGTFWYLITKFGPKISGFLRGRVEQYYAEWDRWQRESLKTLSTIKSSLGNELQKGSVIDELYAARRDDIDMQAELEYRNRLVSVYEETKRRLNYLVAVADSNRQIQQNYLVNWVISNVHSSIGPKQEEEYLTSCIGGLKQLASQKANTI